MNEPDELTTFLLWAAGLTFVLLFVMIASALDDDP
jgi:hypothetical protein